MKKYIVESEEDFERGFEIKADSVEDANQQILDLINLRMVD